MRYITWEAMGSRDDSVAEMKAFPAESPTWHFFEYTEPGTQFLPVGTLEETLRGQGVNEELIDVVRLNLEVKESLLEWDPGEDFIRKAVRVCVRQDDDGSWHFEDSEIRQE